MIDAGVPSFFGLGSEDGHVPTFWLLLQRQNLKVSPCAQLSPGRFSKKGILWFVELLPVRKIDMVLESGSYRGPSVGSLTQNCIKSRGLAWLA